MTNGQTINDPLVGTTYDGRYRIARRIGSGGMANVYLAEDETLGRRVAIKVLHQRYAEDSQFIERFLREASAAAKLNHPNIVQVYDRGQAASTYYIAMEYVDGLTLKDLVRRRGGLTEQEVLAYGRQALHALRFAHRNGIVHRDVKPHNMMVDTDGRLKIADFGIARAAADADSGLTEAGSIVGTAQYLSPEQAQGMHVAAPSDLYSLGVVMFEMATGRVPFDGESPVNVALKHVKDPMPAPSAFKPDISPALESIIRHAMEKDPALRYASADEMLADLDRAREGSQTQAMTAVMGAAATQVTPITPAASRAYETPVAPEPAWPEDEEDDEQRSPWRWLLPLLVVLTLLGAAAFFLFMPSGEPVPDVVGRPLAEARTLIEEDGFAVGRVTRESSDEEPQGTVLSQNPGGGDTAEDGDAIDLVVSSGPEPIEVPNVVGDARATAFNRLQAAGFAPREGERESSDTVKAGIVLSTNPRAGEDLEAGATVVVIVSSGPESQQVPSVIGMSVADATSTLEADPLKLVVETTTVDSTQPEGTVVAQSLAANSKAEPGDTITLEVASGNNAVPDVIGVGGDEAVAELQKAGYETELVSEGTDDPAKIGVVLATDPGPDAVVALGTSIVVTVGEALGDAGGGLPPG
jgi:serine/threonine-protein kinase